MKKEMNKSCFIDGCSQYKETNTSFHRFPTDPELCIDWCRSIKTFNNQENAFTFHRNSYVCGHHFANGDKCIIGKKTKLYKNVIPSIYPRRYEKEHSHNEQMEIENESLTVRSQYSADEKYEERTCTLSDCEDFFGFDEEDLNNGIVNASPGKVLADVMMDEQKMQSANPSETDDEIIFVENNVEVIEIDDDDDDEIPQPASAVKTFSRYDIQRMVITNNPQIELLKPKLDWKSDQFRLVYINGEKQNLCTCTKCWELFDEISIDTIVRHARCNPAPKVSPGTKRKKMVEQQENATVQETSANFETAESLTVSKIQTIAACMDVQTSTFYQGKRFLHFAQFLVDAGASVASANKNKLISICEPKYDVLCSFKDQLKESQQSKILSILNTPNIEYSLSCEVWEDTFRQKTNVSIDLHYLDTDFRQHRIVIGVRSIIGVTVEDKIICDRILEMLRVYSTKKDGTEFLQKATTFVTSRKLDTRSLATVSFPSACSIMHEIANGIVNEEGLKIAEKCLHIIGWLNVVSTEKITVFDARKWENIFVLFKSFEKKKDSFMHRATESTFPQQDYSILQLLEPFHAAVNELSESTNNITKVFGIYKLLESNLKPQACDKEIVKSVKSKALESLRTAFADSDAYQICMFLDPSNRDQYNALESGKMDTLQSKIDIMINPYMSTKQNGCVDNDLIHYMDDNVTSQQNQIDMFLQWLTPSKDNPFKFWRDNEHQMPGLKALARKYFTIPTYSSLSECTFSEEAKNFLLKRNTLEVKDMETMLMMNSSQLDGDRTIVS